MSRDAFIVATHGDDASFLSRHCREVDSTRHGFEVCSLVNALGQVTVPAVFVASILYLILTHPRLLFGSGHLVHATEGSRPLWLKSCVHPKIGPHRSTSYHGMLAKNPRLNRKGRRKTGSSGCGIVVHRLSPTRDSPNRGHPNGIVFHKRNWTL